MNRCGVMGNHSAPRAGLICNLRKADPQMLGVDLSLPVDRRYSAVCPNKKRSGRMGVAASLSRRSSSGSRSRKEGL
jgi:hypothetical protein